MISSRLGFEKCVEQEKQIEWLKNKSLKMYKKGG